MENLRIGKADKFYTLWKVNIEENIEMGYTNFQYIYQQNLSHNKFSAIEKAKLKGCTDLDIDESLRGKTMSFSTRVDREFLPHEFKFGKYKGESILECTDINYLDWFCSEFDVKMVVDRLVSISENHFLKDGVLMDSTELNEAIEKEKFFNSLKKSIQNEELVLLTFKSNINSSSEVKLDNDYYLPYLGAAVERSYQGYGYWLPTINGTTGKKIKNKLLPCQLMLDDEGNPAIQEIHF